MQNRVMVRKKKGKQANELEWAEVIQIKNKIN